MGGTDSREIGTYGITASSSSEHCSKTVSPSPDFDWTRWEDALHYYSGLKDAGLFLPLSWEKKLNYTCMENGKLQLSYPAIRSTLSDEIAQRALSMNRLTKEDLWFLLLQLADACRAFERRGERLGHIHPSYVLFSKLGRVLLVNRYSWPQVFLGPQRVIEGGRGCLLSPQQLQHIELKMLYGGDSPNADSFGIGMTMLEAGTLQPAQRCYDYSNCRLETQEFQRLKAVFRAQYHSDPYLVKTVQNLVDLREKSRPSPGQVSSLLNPYRQEIGLKLGFRPSKERSLAQLERFEREKRQG